MTHRALGSLIEPGMRVLHPARPDWGVGQVQSAIGDRVTVNFEHAGKVLVNAAVVALNILDDDQD
jgi:FKBP-type peptidyl-prolyl cis-trans isomerase 2